MKKSIRIVAAFVAALSLTACTGSTNANTAEEDSIQVVGLTEGAEPAEVVNALEEKVNAGDAASLNQAVETIQTELQEIIESGDAEKAAAYASQIKAFIDENAEKLQELNINTLTLNDIINAAKALPATAEESAESAAAAAEADAIAAKDAAVDAAKAKADEVIEEGKAKAGEAVETGKAKANEAVQDAANKANDAASKAINDAANKLKL